MRVFFDDPFLDRCPPVARDAEVSAPSFHGDASLGPLVPCVCPPFGADGEISLASHGCL